MKIKLLHPKAKLPTQGSAAAAGYDLYAVIDDILGPDGNLIPGFIEIAPHHTAVIPLGFAMEIPYGYWGGIYPRSGLATKQGLRPANCVGVIDNDYRGEIKVALHNDSDNYRYVYCGDRIAQLIFQEQCSVIPDEDGNLWQVVDELSVTARGEGGFGSTGTGTATATDYLPYDADLDTPMFGKTGQW